MRIPGPHDVCCVSPALLLWGLPRLDCVPFVVLYVAGVIAVLGFVCVYASHFIFITMIPLGALHHIDSTAAN